MSKTITGDTNSTAGQGGSFKNYGNDHGFVTKFDAEPQFLLFNLLFFIFMTLSLFLSNQQSIRTVLQF